MTFDQWYDSMYPDGWWKDRREELRKEWDYAAQCLDEYEDNVEVLFSAVANAIKDQYGD